MPNKVASNKVGPNKAVSNKAVSNKAVPASNKETPEEKNKADKHAEMIRGHINEIHKKRKIKEEQKKQAIAPSVLKSFADFATSILGVVGDEKGAEEAKAMGDIVEEITKDLLFGDLKHLRDHLKDPKFNKRVKDAVGGIKNVVKGIKIIEKKAIDAGLEAIHDTEAIVEEVDSLLEPLGIDLDKLERMGCDEILGLLEVSAVCAELMSFKEAGEKAIADGEKAINKLENSPMGKMAQKGMDIADKANALTSGGGKRKTKKYKKKKKNRKKSKRREIKRKNKKSRKNKSRSK